MELAPNPHYKDKMKDLGSADNYRQLYTDNYSFKSCYLKNFRVLYT